MTGSDLGQQVDNLVGVVEAGLGAPPTVEDMAQYCLSLEDALKGEIAHLKGERQLRMSERERHLQTRVTRLSDEVALLRDANRQMFQRREEVERENDGVFAQNFSFEQQLEGAHAELQRLQRLLAEEEDMCERFRVRLVALEAQASDRPGEKP